MLASQIHIILEGLKFLKFIHVSQVSVIQKLESLISILNSTSAYFCMQNPSYNFHFIKAYHSSSGKIIRRDSES
jgi:hypothetical protein